MTKKIKKGYKASNNGVCRDITYVVGRTYTKRKLPIMCKYGYHYCEEIDDIFEYYVYADENTKIFEIEDLGRSCKSGTKSVTNKIKIIREIPVSEYNDLFERTKFDERGNMLMRTYRNGSWCKIIYDENGRVIRKEDSAGWWKVYEHTPEGYMSKCVDSFGWWDTYEYTTNGRITSHLCGKNSLIDPIKSCTICCVSQT